MVTLNKPAANDTTWETDLTDNWTTIENSLVDKSLWSAKGAIVAATGSAALAGVAPGTAGSLLIADSTQSAGMKWVEPLVQDQIDLLWGKKFFSDEGFLPSTKMFEHVGTPPAFDGTAGSGSWTLDPGAARVSASGGIAWYDLGAAKSKILIVVGNMIEQNASYNQHVHLTSSAPTGVDPDGFSMRAPDTAIYRHQSGAYTRLDTSTGFSGDYRAGFALYYDDATDTLKLFLRMGGQWFLAQGATSTAFTTLRYVAFQSGIADQAWAVPFVCYAQ